MTVGVQDPHLAVYDEMCDHLVGVLRRIADSLPSVVVPPLAECARCHTRQPADAPCLLCAATVRARVATPPPTPHRTATKGMWLRSDGIVDDVAVDRCCKGEVLPLTDEERDEALRRLHARRMGDGEIAKRLHVSKRSVLRWRVRLGLPAAVDHSGEPLSRTA